MNNVFIYVFDDKSKQKLMDIGVDLLFDKPNEPIYIFRFDKSNERLTDTLNSICYVLSETLLF